ncbi:PALP-domain-containing protein [Lactarius hengduanensis]|nr:PALP-domain-containing protein [Lactarius hengduanensis]
MSWVPSPSTARHLFYGILIGFSLSIASTSVISTGDASPRPIELRSDEVLDGVTGLIGNTPLVRINSLSNALGVEILGKAEYLNPGGSVKDRARSKVLIEHAEREGLLHPYTGSRIFEGTSGSTGISIATIARARFAIVLPDDVSLEKNLAREYALDFTKTPAGVTLTRPRGYFADQFENRCNFAAHFTGTGPEIWRQTNGEVAAFVAGAGTGRYIAGTGQFLKSMADDVLVKHGVMYDHKESEGTRRRHQVDTNIELALPITDAEAVSMARFLVQRDGLFLGSSSAVNLVACVKLKVVTVLCDSGARHYSKVRLNDAYLSKAGIPIDVGIVQDLLTQPFPPMSSITKI